MCTLFLSFQSHPQYPLIIASNRDEVFSRPTAISDFWQEENSGETILSGRDLQSKGAWLGISPTNGRWSVITNFRGISLQQSGKKSRGDIVVHSLCTKQSITQEMEELGRTSQEYNPFNFLYGTIDEMAYISNQRQGFQSLQPGVYGQSNALLNAPWPKVKAGKQVFTELINKESDAQDLTEALFQMLQNKKRAEMDELPDTGVPKEVELMLSSLFVDMYEFDYGTSQSTVVLIDNDGNGHWTEITWSNTGEEASRVNHSFNFPTKP